MEDSAFTWGNEDPKRSLYPIRHTDLWEMRNTIGGLHWLASEVNLTDDKKSWEKMTQDEKNAVIYALAFFSHIDLDVLAVVKNFSDKIDCLEAKMFYTFQSAQESVHAEAYGLQIETLLDGEEKEFIRNAAVNLEIIRKIHAWALSCFKDDNIGKQLVAMAAIEGILFCSSFAQLQWLREKNLLPGVTAFNEYIRRDENKHTEFSCHLIKTYLRVKPDIATVREIISSLLVLIDELIDLSLPKPLTGISAESLKQYVRHQSDIVTSLMGYGKLYNQPNPLAFMEKHAMNMRTNFFEHRPTQYQGIKSSDQIMVTIDDTPIDGW